MVVAEPVNEESINSLLEIERLKTDKYKSMEVFINHNINTFKSDTQLIDYDSSNLVYVAVVDIIDNVLIGYPKINYLDSTDIFDLIANSDENISDLSFFWKNKIDIVYINDNYLGPCVNSVISYYNNLLK